MVDPNTSSPTKPYLVFLLEAVSLGRLHLVDVLEEVGHPHRGVQLARVIGRALPPTVPVRRASQQAAGLVDGAALFVCGRRAYAHRSGLRASDPR